MDCKVLMYICKNHYFSKRFSGIGIIPVLVWVILEGKLTIRPPNISCRCILRQKKERKVFFCLGTGVPRLCAGFGTSSSSSSSSASLAYS